jgi:hypothetical protein
LGDVEVFVGVGRSGYAVYSSGFSFVDGMTTAMEEPDLGIDVICLGGVTKEPVLWDVNGNGTSIEKFWEWDVLLLVE